MPSDTRSAYENSNELAGPQKDNHRSSYASSADPTKRKLHHSGGPTRPHGGAGRPLPPDKKNVPPEAPSVVATAAELEEALQEVARRGARIDALTCEVAWYRHWADSYWQQLQQFSVAAAASSQHQQQQQLAAIASFQAAANQSYAAAAQSFAAAAAASGQEAGAMPHGGPPPGGQTGNGAVDMRVSSVAGSNEATATLAATH